MNPTGVIKPQQNTGLAAPRRAQILRGPAQEAGGDRRRTHNFIFLLSVEGSGPLSLGGRRGLALGPACGALAGGTPGFRCTERRKRKQAGNSHLAFCFARRAALKPGTERDAARLSTL